VYASLVPHNTASRRVFEKLGASLDDGDEARAYADEPGDIVMASTATPSSARTPLRSRPLRLPVGRRPTGFHHPGTSCRAVAGGIALASLPGMLPLLLAPLVPAPPRARVSRVLRRLRRPVDWAMHTDVHGSRESRRIALTFDDGPDPDRTPALLDTLAALGAPATFFLLGRAVEKNPELAARIAREGHEIGNHTYNHRYLPLQRSSSVARELAEADATIARATGVVPTLARPPYGGRSPFTVRAFARAGKRVVLWDLNSFD